MNRLFAYKKKTSTPLFMQDGGYFCAEQLYSAVHFTGSSYRVIAQRNFSFYPLMLRD
ncbi:hypothetical protein SAMN04488601_10542 [Paenibacillus sp. 453mf]|nr:hypothetical protein SAMN04488601_10542 [Paenibacillus sp. 453mf]